ncbi:MAG: RES domain-containing protein [Saprospiraceae bacterium]|jgi:RES domain-containing protein
MKVYRISNKKYAEQLNGEGAYRVGGRWNSKGVRMIYTSTSIALASLEVLVHSDGIPIPDGMILLTLEVPNKYIQLLEKPPFNWNEIPPQGAAKIVGDDFIKFNKVLGLKVPSAIIPEEYNLLINPLHMHIDKIEIVSQRDYAFDGRL